jgi:hypothetical protein
VEFAFFVEWAGIEADDAVVIGIQPFETIYYISNRYLNFIIIKDEASVPAIYSMDI